MVWSDKGVTLIKLAKYKEALECFNKALEINPDYKPALRHREELVLHGHGE